MKTQYLVLATATLLLSHSAFSQKVTPARAKQTTTTKPAPLTATDKAFVQDAINSNNEAMALAQMGMQRSKDNNVKKIARQFMGDHAMAQRKLYAIAQIRDTVPYGRMTPTNTNTANKLPLSDNIDSRRNRTLGSISTTSDPATPTTQNTTTTGNTVVGTGTNQQSTTAGTAYNNSNNNYGKNQMYNGITSIDNANGVNNANRTDVGSYSGRFSETNTVAYTQNPQAYNQGNTQPAANDAYNRATTVNRTLSVLPNNGTDIMPDFATRTPDTVRQTGMSDGFEQPGTNLTFPNSPLYSKTTPAPAPNGNTGSDYGRANVVVNNVQTNALNTAPYSNNEINGNIVQTGQLQGTSNPAAVINSSTASLTNTQVAYNNSNANRADQVPVQARPNGTIVINNQNRPTTSGGSTSTNPAIAVPVGQTPNNSSSPVVAGAVSQTNTPVTSNNGRTTIAGAISSGSNGYATSIANTNSMSTLRSTDTDAFDAQWAIEMNNNQQAAIQKYMAALKTTHNAQIRNYINSVLPLLQGHQIALSQWQGKGVQ